MARGLTYVATFTAVSATAAQDLFSILAAANIPIEILWARVSCEGQASPTELRLQCKRIAAAALGSGGTVVTPAEKGQVSGRAAAATVHANDTTRATTTGSKQVLWVGTIQDLNNLDDVMIPELWPMIPAGDALIVGLEVAPGSAVTLFGAAQFSELD